MGFDTIHSDAGVYILRHHHKRGDSETDMILILYVNDLLLLGEDLSSGCTEHVTPVQSDLHNYREYNPPGKAEITDGKFITIKGQGNIIGHSLLPDNMKLSMEIRRVLYIPDVSKWLFLLITARRLDHKSETTRWGTIVSQNNIPFIIREPCENKLHYFNFELVRSTDEIPNMVITTISCDYTLWHRRLGHTNQHVIHNLTDNTEGSPE